MDFARVARFALCASAAAVASVSVATAATPKPKPTPAPRAVVRASRPAHAPPRRSALIGGVPVRRPHDPPKIVGIQSSAVAAGRPFAATVRTTSNVASVEVRIGGYSQSLPRVSVGRFRFAYDVPSFLPPMMRRGYTVQFIARNVDGMRDERDLSLAFR